MASSSQFSSWGSKAIRAAVKRVDRAIERIFDRFSPADLRVKYIIALLATAAALSAGQILIQFSLSEQLAEVRRIRNTDRLALVVDSLSRLNEKIPLEVTKEQVFKDIAQYRRLLTEIRQMAVDLTADWPRGFLATSFQTEAWEAVSESLAILEKLTEVSRPLFSAELSDMETATQVQTRIYSALEEAEPLLTHLAASVSQVNSKLGGSLIQRMNGLQARAFLIVLLILTILFLQGMYVFRPSIRKLYRAIEARSDLLSRLGHEIRNPLNAVIGISNILLKREPGVEERNLLRRQKLASENLLSLLNNLLKTAESDSGEVRLSARPTTLHLLIDELVEVYSQVAAEKNLEFCFSYDSTIAREVVCDDVKLKEVLMNLLGNAIKFTGSGRVTLSVGKIEETRFGTTLRFAVADSGIGISKDNIDRIFERFVQENESIKRRYGGSGLGLSICQMFLKLMNSRLQVSSEKGSGSVFSFQATFSKSGPPLADEISRQLENITKIEFIGVSGIERRHIEEQVGRLSVKCVFLPAMNERPSPSTVVFVNGRSGSEPLSGENIFYLAEIAGERKSATDAASSKICVRPFKVWDVPRLLSAPPEHSRQTVENLRHRLDVLVVDDSFDNQVILADIVEELGGQVKTVSSANEAFAELERNPVDVVFMDIQMPDIDGYMALQEIRHRCWKMPVIAVTAHETEVEKNKIRQAGFNGHIVKPVHLEEISACLIEHGKAKAKIKKRRRVRKLPQTPGLPVRINSKIESMIPAYLKKRGEDVDKMEAALAAMRLTEIASISHRIRGSARTFGFDEIDALARGLESAAENANPGKVRELLDSFKETVETYRTEAVQ